MRSASPEPTTLDAVVEPGDELTVKVYKSSSGYTLAIDCCGVKGARTVVRIGGIKQKDVPTTIVKDY